MAAGGWVLVKVIILLINLHLGRCISGFPADPIARQELDKVSVLPGQKFNIRFSHYSGYVKVNEESGRALFYWFIEAEEDPDDKPLVLWLNGAEDSLAFLLKWFERFPQYKGREFYLTGESYAGHYVPQLSQAIVDYNKEAREKIINVKGFMVGNALTDDHRDHLGLFQFMWSAGLISDETFKLLNDLCDFQSFIHTSNSCDNILDVASQELGNIDPYSIFTPPCSASAGQSNRLRKRMKVIGHVIEKYDPCTEKHSIAYFNHPEVQKALHVDKEFAPAKWDTCSDAVNSNWKDSPITVLDIYRKLIPEGLRIWVFSGDTDAVIPVTSTRYSIDALGLGTVKPWRAWYDENQVGGWTQEYEGLTFVSVRGAGHEVPLHKPKLALSLIKSYLGGNSMPKQLELISDA